VTWRLAVAALLGALTLAGCHASPADVTRWETSEDGPERLAKAVQDEGASVDVRGAAGLALVRLERRGRHVGLPMLADTLAASSEAGRARVIAAMAPELVARAGSGDLMKGSPDPSLPAKDALHLLLARGLVQDPSQAAAFRTALESWLRASLPRRMADRTQRYTPPETMRLLGPASSRGLLTLAGPHGGLERIAKVLREIGSDADRKAQAEELGAMLREYPWHDRELAAVAEANRTANPSAAQLEKAASAYADDGVGSIIQAVSTLGVIPTGAILDVFERATTPAKLRERLLGVLAAHPEAVDAPAVQRLWTMLRRGGEVRLQSAQLLLPRIGPGEIEAFLGSVSEAKVPGAGYREAMAYGPALMKIAGREALRAYTKSKTPVIRAIALSGLADEPATIRTFDDDKGVLPSAAEGSGWSCPASGLVPVHDESSINPFAKSLMREEAKFVNLSALMYLGGGDNAPKEEPPTVGSFVCSCLEASRCMAQTRVY
jgi:hypothetical protein